jgi:hypothetical protein
VVGKLLRADYFPRLFRVGKNFMHRTSFCGLANALNKPGTDGGFGIHLNKPVFYGRAARIDDQNIHATYPRYFQKSKAF